MDKIESVIGKLNEYKSIVNDLWDIRRKFQAKGLYDYHIEHALKDVERLMNALRIELAKLRGE